MAQGTHNDVLEDVLREQQGLRDRVRRLELDNDQLRSELRVALARMRAAAVLFLNEDDEPEPSELIGLRSVDGSL